ncbi:hypothetical protein L1D16_04470 [Vibrio sp. Isolate31]|uniref:hypothetical protein n=1 Tax=Vibrio sp. Isolate31 TaxID=2908537 RepID=UPI001EFDA0CC|nr:hypothetical protein [Vibrio sp. Isolate31]MCG9600187.1 hypothetical protein [Vibrio sp. Isolate31]
MKIIERLFLRRLKVALEQEKPREIVRSGTEAYEADYYSVFLSDSEGDYLAVSLQGESLTVKKWDGIKRIHDEEEVLSLTDLNRYRFMIRRWYGLGTFDYEHLGKFVFMEYSRVYKLESLWLAIKHGVPKILHGKKRLAKPTRLVVLELIDRVTEEDPYKELRSSQLCNDLYGMYSIYNKKRKPRNDRVQRILESLVESGELRAKDSFTFVARGKLLVTLEHLQEEKARQDRAESNARWMALLTLILVVAALLQSGLVRTSYFSNIDWLVEVLFDWIKTMKG